MKIAINGAGIAGTALAYWLHRIGHEPTLIEQAPHFRTGGYMIDFWGLGYDVVERMGVLPAVLEAGYAVREARFVASDGAKIGGFSVDSMRRTLHGRMTSLPRGELARALYGTVESRVETLFGNSIVQLDERGEQVEATLAKGAPRTFDLVIGADGQHSSIRRALFGCDGQFQRQLGYYVAAFDSLGYRPRDELAYVSYARPGRQIARFAMRDDRTMFLLIFDRRLLADEDAGPATRKTQLRTVFEQCGWESERIVHALEAATEFYFDDVSQIALPSWSKGRVALVGDAASCVSLLAGEGTGLALTQAYVLAGELHRAGNDYELAFSRYERSLRQFIDGKQKSAREFANSFAPKTAFGIWVRNQATKLMQLPGVANVLLGRTMRDDFELPDYGM